MKGSAWHKAWVRILLTGLTLAMMVLIFFFSTENAEKSDKTSGKITETVIQVVYPEYTDFRTERKVSIYNHVQHIVRKSAHFTEYTLLGILYRLTLFSWFGKRRWAAPAAWGIGTIYASTDELHQMLIDGRAGQWQDVLLDSSGVLCGVLLTEGFLYLLHKRHIKS